MNTEMILKVADYIEQHPTEFDMSTWWRVSECGTTMCIGGITCMLSGLRRATKYEVVVDGLPVLISQAARDLLGLDPIIANRLFAENWPNEYLQDGCAKPRDAVRYLRDLAAGVATL